MRIEPGIFKAYDIRGVVGDQFSAEDFTVIGRALGDWMAERGGERAVVGRDVRPSSEELEAAFVEGLASTGLEVHRIGVCTSPQFYFALKVLEADGGATITASHNPSEYNGLKIRMGGPVYGDGLQELRRRAEAGRFRSGGGSVHQETGILDRYLERAAEGIEMARPLRVVLDGGNGTGGPAAVRLFEALGCRVVPLYCEPDGTFPNHHPNPLVAENLDDLRERVTEEGADLGVSYDGDADRMTLVDEAGTIRWTDRSLAVVAGELLPGHPGRAVIFDVKASQAVVDVVEAAGGKPVMVKTGYPFLLDAMDREHGLVGAELSGHMYFDHPIFDFDDGVYASARVAEVLARGDGPVSAAYAELPSYVSSTEIRVHCPDERKFAVAEGLAAGFAREHQVVTIDGARVRFEGGWGLVRASNTEPDLVLVFEARDAATLEEIRGTFREALEAYPEVDAGSLD